MRYLSLSLIACAVVHAASPVPPLFQAIRNNDVPQIKRLLKEEPGVNTRGKNQTTPLMHAAAFGTIESMRLLLNAGADVNAKNAFDATALMWSASELAKVRLLVEKGAGVNAKSKQGRTALLIAASHSNGAPIVRYLIAHGADPKAVDGANTTALMAAADANDTEDVRLLIEAGVDVNAANFMNSTALMSAAPNNNLAAVQLLLKAGAHVNAKAGPSPFMVKAGHIAQGEYTALTQGAMYGSPEVITALLDAGADVNAKEARGMTPLMMAVTSEYQRADVVQLLLARGANPKLTSLAGETAADWAAKFNYPAVTKLLGVNSPVGMESSFSSAVTPGMDTAKRPRAGLSQAVNKSVALLQTTNTSFFQGGACAGCHNQHLTAFALRAGRGRPVPFDEKAAAEQVKLVSAEFVSQMDLLQQRIGLETIPSIASFATFGLQAADYPADLITDTIVSTLASEQRTDGSWATVVAFSNPRPPMQDGEISVTARCVLALRDFGFPARQPEFNKRIERARQWLTATVPRSTDDRTMQLLGLKWSGANPKIISRFAKELMAEQRPSGGWGQNPYLASDAYATGQALYALHEAAGIEASAPCYERGTNFLLDTQKDDGSWHVKSRSVKFQPYFQSGFPHNHDQWISTAGTAWAVAALELGLPVLSVSRY